MENFAYKRKVFNTISKQITERNTQAKVWNVNFVSVEKFIVSN